MSTSGSSRVRWDVVLSLSTPTADQRRARIETLLKTFVCTDDLEHHEVQAYLEIMVSEGALAEADGRLEIAGKPGALNVPDEEAGMSLRTCAGQLIRAWSKWEFMGHVTRGSGARGCGAGLGYSRPAEPPSLDEKRKSNRSAHNLAARELDSERWAASTLLSSLPQSHHEPVRALYDVVFRRLRARIETLDREHSVLLGAPSRADLQKAQPTDPEIDGLPPRVKAIASLYRLAVAAGHTKAKAQYAWLKANPEVSDALPGDPKTYARYARRLKNHLEGPRKRYGKGMLRAVEHLRPQREDLLPDADDDADPDSER